jgi:hypothetical protein
MTDSQSDITTGLDAERRQALAAQAKTEREKNQTVVRRETELVPLWNRIKARSVQNGFGEDYELALTRKRPA